MIDTAAILTHAKRYEDDMARFLREMIAIPSESCQEGQVIQRIQKEMLHVGFDEVSNAVDIEERGSHVAVNAGQIKASAHADGGLASNQAAPCGGIVPCRCSPGHKRD